MSDINLENLDRFNDAIYDSTIIDLPNDSLVLALIFCQLKLKKLVKNGILMTPHLVASI